MKPNDEELARIVMASNAIALGTESPGYLLFDDHLEAARQVRDAPKLLSPRQIHGVLVRRFMVDAGEYYTLDVGQSERLYKPRYTAIPRLMVELDTMVRNAVGVCTTPGRDPMECAVTARILHAHAMCIHPFRVGNGRTLRLWWNQLRQHFGLPWEAVPLDGHQAYYHDIEDYEARVFRVRYPNVY